MRWMRLRAGIVGLLGAGVLGFSGGAWATSEPCRCIIENMRVEPEVSCLTITPHWSCDISEVMNNCNEPVKLVNWPLKSSTCQSRECTTVLLPTEQALFTFAGMELRDSGSSQGTYLVQFGDGEEQSLTMFGDITCPSYSRRPRTDEGCASAPGALAALGVLLMTGPMLRRRCG